MRRGEDNEETLGATRRAAQRGRREKLIAKITVDDDDNDG